MTTTPNRYATHVPIDSKRRSGLARIMAISRAEVLLYLRRPMILIPALIIGPAMAALCGPMIGDGLIGSSFSAFLVQMLASWSLLTVVYYNTTVISVTRRNEGVFQRMATGQATPWEAFIAATIPSVIIVCVQTVLSVIGVALILFPLPMTNVALPVLGLAGGAAFMGAAAAWTSSWTSRVGAAQYTTMPLFLVLLVTSGSMLDLRVFPEAVQTVASFTPLYAVNDLIGLGLNGSNLSATHSGLSFVQSWSPAVFPLVVLTGWSVLAWLLARQTMRFDRRT